jgi:putative transcriptional regulator
MSCSLVGSFLVARPVLHDPSFRRTVVLLLQHGSEGAFGLVVNRPKAVTGLPFPLYIGGPCEAEGLIMLHGHADWLGEEDDVEENTVAPGVFLGDAGCLERASEPPPGGAFRFRVFKGYSGWGPNQLEGELAAGAWAILPLTDALLFDTPVEELWDRLAPPPIPQPSLN